MDRVTRKGEIISADMRSLISQRYRRITKAVNLEFWNIESETAMLLFHALEYPAL